MKLNWNLLGEGGAKQKTLHGRGGGGGGDYQYFLKLHIFIEKCFFCSGCLINF